MCMKGLKGKKARKRNWVSLWHFRKALIVHRIHRGSPRFSFRGQSKEAIEGHTAKVSWIYEAATVSRSDITWRSVMMSRDGVIWRHGYHDVIMSGGVTALRNLMVPDDVMVARDSRRPRDVTSGHVTCTMTSQCNVTTRFHVTPWCRLTSRDHMTSLRVASRSSITSRDVTCVTRGRNRDYIYGHEIAKS